MCERKKFSVTRRNRLKYIASPVIMLYNIVYISIIGNRAVWSDFSYDGVS